MKLSRFRACQCREIADFRVMLATYLWCLGGRPTKQLRRGSTSCIYSGQSWSYIDKIRSICEMISWIEKPCISHPWIPCGQVLTRKVWEGSSDLCTTYELDPTIFLIQLLSIFITTVFLIFALFVHVWCTQNHTVWVRMQSTGCTVSSRDSLPLLKPILPSLGLPLLLWWALLGRNLN